MKYKNNLKKTVTAILLTAIFYALTACSPDESDPSNLTAWFSTDKVSYYAGEEVLFTDGSTGGTGSYNYQWDFGDGTSSTEQNPGTVYPSTGSYTVQLTVTDSKGKRASAKKAVVVDTSPLPQVGNLILKWVSSVTLGEVRSNTPAVSDDGFVYMISNDHTLRKFSPETGNQVWAFDLRNNADGASPEGNTHTTPSIDTDGTVYVGTGDVSGKVARVYAVKPDGTKKWVVAGDAEAGFWNKGAASTPRINYLTCTMNESHVFMGNGGSTGSVIAVDKQTGRRAGYVTNAAGDGGPSGGVTSGLVITKDGTVVWAGGANGFFGASATQLAQGGNVVWAWQVMSTGDDKPSANPNGSMAVAADGTIYAIVTLGSGTHVLALSSDGLEKWRTLLPGVGSQDQGGIVIAEDGTVIVTCKRVAGEATGGIVALESSGNMKWNYGIPEDVSGVAAIDQAGNIHFGTQSGNYYIVSPHGGTQAELLVKKDVASMIAESSYVGKTAWTAERAKIWSSPVIADNGMIYIGVTHIDDPSKSVLIALTDEGVTGPGLSPWPMKGQNRRHTGAGQ